MEYPLAYLITFTTYGTWLHGDRKGSVDKVHNQYGGDFVKWNLSQQHKERAALKNQPVTLSAKQQELVLDAIAKVCDFRSWTALAVHVRTNHVHIVMSGLAEPEKMMADFKAYATRGLRKYDGLRTTGIKYWTQHGSTRYLWTRQSVATAIKYVTDGQGEMMAFGATYTGTEPRT